MIVLRPAAGVRGRSDELVFSPDGTMLVAPRRGRHVLVWSGLTNGSRAELLTLPDGGGETRVAFSPDGTLFAGNDHLFAIDLINRSTSPYPIPSWDSLWFGVSPDGSRLVVAELNKSHETSRITGWDVGDYREPAWEVNVVGLVWSPPLFSADGKEFIFSEHRRAANRQWYAHRVRHSVATGKELDAAGPFADVPEVMVPSADGLWLACRTREVVRVYPATGTWENIPAVTNDSKKHFTGIAFHPSGKFLAATSNDKTVKLYDTATWTLAKTFTWDIGRMRSIAFSPDGNLAAAGSDSGKVVVWDVDV